MKRLFPILEALPSLGAVQLRGDVAAGLTTAVMLVPQAMAYAMLADLPPVVGLYASMVPVALYALLGTSRQLAVGPVAMVSLLVASAIGSLAESGTSEYLSLAITLAAMVGVLQLGMGLLRMGVLVNFLSHPVVSGFTSAAALIIASSQLKHLLGVSIPRTHHVHEVVIHAAEQFGAWDLPTIGVSVAGVAGLMALKQLGARFPRHLVVVVAATAGVAWLGLDVATVGAVPGGLPAPALPTFGLATIRALAPMAVTIALVGFMESVAVAKTFAQRNRYELDTNRELVALGAANLGSALFGAYPVTGGFSRTAVNAQAGAQTQLAGLVTAVAVALVVLFLTPWMALLPKAVLAAIILTAVFGLVDVAEARHLWHASRPDFWQLVITFVSTLALGIEIGILVGVLASLAWFVQGATRPHVAVLGRLPDTTLYRKLDRNPTARTTAGVLAVRIDGALFYANTAWLKDTLRDLLHEHDPVHALILDATSIADIDASAAAALEEIADDLQSRGIALWVAGMRGPVRDTLERHGLAARIGPRLVNSVHDAVVGVEVERGANA